MPPLRRTAAIALAVFSILTLVGPALAAPGGNSAASAACENGGYVNFTDTDGNTFRNEGACVRYAAHGGVLVPVVVAPFSVDYSSLAPSVFRATITGTGLVPNSPYELSFVWPDRSVTIEATVGPTGGFTLTHEENCLDTLGNHLTSLTAIGTPAGSVETAFSLAVPPSSICP